MDAPNSEMDRELALAIGKKVPAGSTWSPTSDLAAAWEVVEEVCKKLKCDFKLHHSQAIGILARFELGKKSASITLSRHSSLPPAICEAALAAFREAKG
jgi:hypothetical protein